MKLLEFTERDYERMALNGYRQLNWKPESPFQIVLGTNGCGKSSLMTIINPDPPQSTAFVGTEGFVYRKYEHKGFIYTLSSYNKSGWKHSFIKEDNAGSFKEELNPGGTSTVQWELVRQEFGLSKEVIDLMTDKVDFVSMSPALRCWWITLLNRSDISEATRCHKHFSTLRRDAVGAIKHVGERISSESAKRLSIENIEVVEKEAQLLKSDLTILMENQRHGLPPEWELENEISRLLSDLRTESASVIEAELMPPDFCDLPRPHTLSHIDEVLSNLRQEYNIKDSMFIHYSREYSELDNILLKLKDKNIDGIDELNKRLLDLDTSRDECLRGINLFTLESDMDMVYEDTQECMQLLTDIIGRLEPNPDKTMTASRLAELVQIRDEKQYQVNKALNFVNQIEMRLDHIQNAKSSDCPKCGYQWVEGVSSHEAKHCQELIVSHRTKATGLDEEIRNMAMEINRLEEYGQTYRQLRTMMNEYPRLNPLWEHLRQSNLLFINPPAIIPILYIWESDVKNNKILQGISKEIETIKEAMEFASRLGETGGWHIHDRAKTLEENIETTMHEKDTLRVKVDLLKRYRNEFEEYTDRYNRIQTMVKDLYGLQEKYLQTVRNSTIRESIASHQVHLANLQNTLNEKSTLDGIIKDLQESYDKLIIDREVLQCIAEALSPSDGLIAESLMGIIYAIVDSMNKIITQTWNTPLIIRPCGNKNGELDYRFPVVREIDSDKHGTEIMPTTVSSAQKDIINFAFKLTVYRLLELDDYPLYIDEIGRTFDEQHKVNLSHYIKGLSESQLFSQIFMISHLASQYGSITNAEVLVLDGTNISVPHAYNTCATFE